MKKEKFDEIVEKIGYKREKWYPFHEIDSVYLNSGRGYYPSWRHLRFLITKESRLLIKHGKSEPYGGRINGLNSISGDYTAFTFAAGPTGFQLESSPQSEGFRQPRVGDYIRITEGVEKVYGEGMIKEIFMSLGSLIIRLWTPIAIPRTGRVSFYDPTVITQDLENCIHSTMQEGTYIHFVGNESKKKFKGSFYHEEIKVKDIKEINLVIGSKYYNKTYKLE